MKHLLLAGACALVLASAPAFAQSPPDPVSPGAASPASPSITSPSVTSPSSPSTSSGPCAAGQVLQANGQPCSPSPSISAQGPASASPGSPPANTAQSNTITVTPPSTAQAPASPSLSITPAPSTAQAPSTTVVPKSSTTITATASSGTRFIDRQSDNQLLASNLMGKSVQNSAGDKIGTVKDILFDDQGKMSAFIIGVGGFLGIGEKSVAISFDMIKPSKDKDGNMVLLAASLDKDAINSAPDFITLEDAKARAPSTATPSSPAPAAR